MVEEHGEGAWTFIGRRALVEDISRTMDEVERSTGAFYVIAGEAGIGKTSLVLKVKDMARERGWASLSSECMYGEGSNPYFPLLQAIRHYMEGKECTGPGGGHVTMPMGLLGLTEFEDEWDARPFDRGTSSMARSADDVKLEKERIFETFSELLSGLAQEGPIFFLVEDLHWAQNATCQLLYYLVRTLSDERVLFMGTYRPEDVKLPGEVTATHSLTDLILRLQREGLLIKRELTPFDQAETSSLLRSIVHFDVPKKMAARIHNETGGNPFYIVEFINALKDHEVLTRGSGAVDDDAGAINIPPTVAVFITNRIDRLDQEATKVLQLASVMGREFVYDVMRDILEIEEDRLVEMIEDLMAHRLLEEVPDSKEVAYRFNHSLIREVVYHHMSRSKRRLMHKKVGEAIEKASPSMPDRAVFQLAYHFSKASVLDKALKYNMMAGAKATSTFAFDEAIRHLEVALELVSREEVGKDKVTKQIELLNRLGHITRFLGDPKKAMGYLNEALDLCQGESLQKAATYRRMADVEMGVGSWDEAMEFLRSAIQISRALGDKRVVADCYGSLAYISWKKADLDSVIHYGEKAIEEAKAIDDRTLVGRANIEIGNAYNEFKEDFDRAVEYYEEALRWLDPEKDIEQMSRIYLNMGDQFRKRGDHEKALRHLRKSLEASERMGDISLKAYAIGNIGLSYMDRGEYDEALGHLEESRRIFEKIGTTHMVAMIHLNKAQIARARGDPEETQAQLDMALGMITEEEFPIGYATLLLEQGLLLKERGALQKARFSMRRAIGIYERIGATKYLEKAKQHLKEM
jgi:tetratricopeptide (TPR) repeat protein